MKIAFVIQDLFQQGAQYVTALMVRGFIERNFDVDLIVSKVHADLLKQKDIAPFDVPDKTNIIVLKDRRARNNIGELRHYLRHSDASHVIAMDPNYTLAIAIASLGLKKRPKLAYVEHSSFAGFSDALDEIPNAGFGSRNWFISKLILRYFSHIMAVSTGSARSVERMMGLPQGTVKIVYNPVIDDEFERKVSLSPQHLWLINKTMPTMVVAGAHCEFKNLMMLFEAIKKANELTPVRLIVFGKGPMTHEYRQWIAENDMSDLIDLAGHTAQLPAEIKAADAFIVSSNVESFSVVLVEALAAGTPVISTACPFGPPEILEYGKYGTLVPVGDSDAMAAAIVEQIRNPRPAAPKEAWERFTTEKIVTNYRAALGI